MESSYNNYVYHLDYKGQEFAKISWTSYKGCWSSSSGQLCDIPASSSLSMRSSQKDFIVIPQIQGKYDSPPHQYSAAWNTYFYGTYDVIYSPRNKIVKKGNFDVSTTAFSEYNSDRRGSIEFLVSH